MSKLPTGLVIVTLWLIRSSGSIDSLSNYGCSNSLIQSSLSNILRINENNKLFSDIVIIPSESCTANYSVFSASYSFTLPVSLHLVTSSHEFSMIENLENLNSAHDTGIIVVLFPGDLKSLRNFIRSIVKVESTRQILAKGSLTYLVVWHFHITANIRSEIEALLGAAGSKGFKVLSLMSKVYWMISTGHRQKANFENAAEVYLYFETYFLAEHNMRINRIQEHNLGNAVISRMNLSGLIIVATAPSGNLTQGEIIWKSDEYGVAYLKTGFGVEIFKCLEDSLHFTSVSLPTVGWASLYPNGTWQEGMAKEVIDGRADIGLAKTSILPYRAQALCYLQPIHTLIVTAYFKQPADGTLRNIFVQPFEYRLWICIMSTWLIFFVAIVSLGWLKNRIHRVGNQQTSESLDSLDPLVWIVSAICQRGLHYTPVSYSSRIIFIVGEILALVVFVAYSATLVSIFSTPNTPIKSIEDLIRSPLRLVVDVNNAGAKLVVSKSNLSTTSTNRLLISRVANGGKHSYASAPNATGVITTTSLAFMTFSDTFYSTLHNVHGRSDKFICDYISAVTVTSIPFRSGLFLAKTSVYKQSFSVKMANLFTSGLLHRYVKGYEDTYVPACNNDLKETKSPILEIPHVLSAFLFLGVLFIISIAILMYEILRYKCVHCCPCSE